MNKKGAALILVIIIMLVLTMFGGLMFTMANASISSADTGTKSCEAHANAKSGYDYVRALAPVAIDVARAELNNELNKKIADPSYEPDLEPKATNFLGYMDANGDFILKETSPTEQINEDDPEYKKARIQVSFDFERTLSFVETDAETKAGTFTSVSTITAKSTGRSDDTSLFPKALGKGISLDFVIDKTQYGTYHGEDVVIDPLIIPGTDLKVKWAFNDYQYQFGNQKPPKGTTFYHDGEYYVYNTNAAPNKIDKLNKLNVPPIWILTGWNGNYNGELSLRTSMNKYLQSHSQNSGFSGTLQLYDVVQFDNKYYAYISTMLVTPKPGALTTNTYWLELIFAN